MTLAIAEPVKLAPAAHVRSKAARGKNSSHTASPSVHAAPTHSEKTGHFKIEAILNN